MYQNTSYILHKPTYQHHTYMHVLIIIRETGLIAGGGGLIGSLTVVVHQQLVNTQ